MLVGTDVAAEAGGQPAKRASRIGALSENNIETIGLANESGLGCLVRWSDKGDSDKRSSRDATASTVRQGEYFGDQHRAIVQNYYHEQSRTGRCPPGLAKKGNGCMPPGQAKKWAVGRPLPRDVIFYDVPRELVVQIGGPPAGYRYARVASDILLIAVGTGMVIDAIQDLGRT